VPAKQAGRRTNLQSPAAQTRLAIRLLMSSSQHRTLISHSDDWHSGRLGAVHDAEHTAIARFRFARQAAHA
jgi:hypothetical protein